MLYNNPVSKIPNKKRKVKSMSNKSIIAILVGIIALIAGALAAAYLIKKKMDAEQEEFDEFEDFDMIDDDDEFFGEDEYAEYDALNISAPDSIPYADSADEEGEDGEETAEENL